MQKTRNGATVFVWEKISHNARNEPLDLKVYNLACMQSLGLNFTRLKEALAGKLTTDKTKPKRKKAVYGAVKKGNLHV